jgi:hypothetical protein
MKSIIPILSTLAVLFIFLTPNTAMAQLDLSERGKIEISNNGLISMGDGIVIIDFVVDFSDFVDYEPLSEVKIITSYGDLDVEGEFFYPGDRYGFVKLFIDNVFWFDSISIIRVSGKYEGKVYDLTDHVELIYRPAVPVPMEVLTMEESSMNDSFNPHIDFKVIEGTYMGIIQENYTDYIKIRLGSGVEATFKIRSDMKAIAESKKAGTRIILAVERYLDKDDKNNFSIESIVRNVSVIPK